MGRRGFMSPVRSSSSPRRCLLGGESCFLKILSKVAWALRPAEPPLCGPAPLLKGQVDRLLLEQGGVRGAHGEVVVLEEHVP